jgi:hypothetical protein
VGAREVLRARLRDRLPITSDGRIAYERRILLRDDRSCRAIAGRVDVIRTARSIDCRGRMIIAGLRCCYCVASRAKPNCYGPEHLPVVFFACELVVSYDLEFDNLAIDRFGHVHVRYFEIQRTATSIKDSNNEYRAPAYLEFSRSRSRASAARQRTCWSMPTVQWIFISVPMPRPARRRTGLRPFPARAGSCSCVSTARWNRGSTRLGGPERLNSNKPDSTDCGGQRTAAAHLRSIDFHVWF